MKILISDFANLSTITHTLVLFYKYIIHLKILIHVTKKLDILLS